MRNQVNIVGYFPGVIGRITTLHAVYYREHWGLDHTFEAQVSREISEFILSFDPQKDGLWNAVFGEHLAGCIAIVGNRQTPGEARLRWFIVDPAFQGQGIGRTLIERAVLFCKDTGFERISLWTFEGLEKARTIYEQNGFTLTQIHEAAQWGGIIKEQRFDLTLV
ncbi:MAG: GNAT family N-acetyltransferase [Desulfatiglandaceae bacterium]